MRTVLLTVLCGACAFAAGPGGPVPGYVLDSRTAVLRAIYGMPGAMQLSAPVNLPFGVISAGFGPAGDYAIAISDQQPPHAYVVQALASATPVVADLGAVADKSRFLAVNSSGTTALLSAGDGSSIAFVTGLPQAPALSAPVTTAPLAGPITAALVDGSGSCAIAGTGSLETLCQDGTTQRLLPETDLDISSLALANQGKDIIFADRAGKQIVLVSQYLQAANTSVLAAAADGIDTPVAVQALSATEFLVADAGAVALFDINSAAPRSVQSIALNKAPAQLRFLTDRSILLLNDPEAVPFTGFDLSNWQTFFIPAN